MYHVAIFMCFFLLGIILFIVIGLLHVLEQIRELRRDIYIDILTRAVD